MFDETFWVAIAFLLFIGVVVYFKLPGMIAKALDERSARIRQELEEAQRLREEAQALFAEYQRKQRNALKEAEEITAHAAAEAKRMATQAEAELKASLDRRRVMAEAKIAQAEAAAIKEVRDATIDLAVEAARRVMTSELQTGRAEALTDKAIADLRLKLH